MPSAHIGASIVATYAIEGCLLNQEVTPATIGLAAVAGLLPDLDGLIVAAIDQDEGVGVDKKLRHHEFPTHTPLFYLFFTIAIWLITTPETALLCGTVVFLHLLLDSWGTDDGIMWFWPWSDRQLALFPTDLHSDGAFGVEFYRRHLRCWRVMIPEVTLFLGGLIVTAHAFGFA